MNDLRCCGNCQWYLKDLLDRYYCYKGTGYIYGCKDVCEMWGNDHKSKKDRSVK